MVHVRHQVASGGVGDWWRYDDVRRVVFVVFARVTIAVDVCSPHAPRFGAFPIVRHDGTTWRIAPARFTSRGASGELVTHCCALHELLGNESIVLLATPSSVDVAFSRLDS